MPGDVVTSSLSTRFSDTWNYLWVPLLLSVSKELTSAKAEPTLLLPSEIRIGSAQSSLRCPTPDYKLNFWPVIGILTYPGDGASGRLNNDTDASYIVASYMKFVESAGARVIPIIFNEPLEIIHEVGICFCLNSVDCIDLVPKRLRKSFLEFDFPFFLVDCNCWSSLVAYTTALMVLPICDVHSESSQKLWQPGLPCFC